MADTKIKTQKEVYDFKLEFSIDKKLETKGEYSPDYRSLRCLDRGTMTFRSDTLEEAREWSRAFLSLLKLSKEDKKKL